MLQEWVWQRKNNNIRIIKCKHSRVHLEQFLAKNILLEAEIDIEAAKSRILLQLGLDIMVVSSTTLIQF